MSDTRTHWVAYEVRTGRAWVVFPATEDEARAQCAEAMRQHPDELWSAETADAATQRANDFQHGRAVAIAWAAENPW